MNKARWQQIRGTFEKALDIAAGPERDAWLAEACTDDPELRERVQRLLDNDAREDTPLQSGGLLETRGLLESTGIATPAAHLLSEDRTTLPAGTRIGSYVLLDEIAHGGMGTVYEARDDKLARSVAIKVLRQAFPSENARQRFAFEAEVLARLEHPGIARIYETGVFHPADAPEGARLPFFAMELVSGRGHKDGSDLGAWRKRTSPTQEECLTMLRAVCEAMHYGHLQGVVHRDLKPENVLVDADNRPKVIDFGIAKPLVRRHPASPSPKTQSWQVLGTLEYASPEQLVHDDLEHEQRVDARSDVYSLGVIGFWMLSGGSVPHPLGTENLAKIAHTLLEEDAPKLGSLVPSLRGSDAETVIAKALQKVPDRRYTSAAEFAHDLDNLLADRPVLARPTTALYQLQKFAKRNRGLVLTAGLAAIVAISGIAGIVIQNVRVHVEQARTERVSQFFRDVLAGADPFERGRDFTVREALDEAAVEIESRFGDDPILEAEIRDVLGRTYRQLSIYDEAERHQERAIALRGAHDDPNSADMLRSRSSLATLRWLQDRSHEALDIEQDCFRRLMNTVGAKHPQTLDSLQGLALYHKDTGDNESAERHYREVLRLRTEVLGADDPSTLVSQYSLGKLLLDEHRDGPAREILEDVCARRTRVLGADHSDTLITLDVLGLLNRDAGRFEDAERAHRRARDGFAAKLGPTNDHTLASTFHLVSSLVALERTAEAAPIIEDALLVCESVYGPEHVKTCKVRGLTATVAHKNGDTARALVLARAVYETTVQRRGGADREALRAARSYASFLRRSGDPARALSVLSKAQDARGPRSQQSSRPDTYDANQDVERALCLIDQGNYARAEALLLSSLEILRAHRGPGSRDVVHALDGLIALQHAQQKPAQAARWKEERSHALQSRELDLGR